MTVSLCVCVWRVCVCENLLLHRNFVNANSRCTQYITTVAGRSLHHLHLPTLLDIADPDPYLNMSESSRPDHFFQTEFVYGNPYSCILTDKAF